MSKKQESGGKRGKWGKRERNPVYFFAQGEATPYWPMASHFRGKVREAKESGEKESGEKESDEFYVKFYTHISYTILTNGIVFEEERRETGGSCAKGIENKRLG